LAPEQLGEFALVLRYIIAPLQRQHASVGAAAIQLLDTPQPSIEAVLTLVINDVVMLGAPLWLVLDDFQHIRAPARHQALTYLVKHLPPNMAHPPGRQPVARLRSGFRDLIQRCPQPVLAVPGDVSPLVHGLIAYDGSPRAEEALNIAAYLALR
jgi:hypothetical protein